MLQIRNIERTLNWSGISLEVDGRRQNMKKNELFPAAIYIFNT